MCELAQGAKCLGLLMVALTGRGLGERGFGEVLGGLWAHRSCRDGVIGWNTTYGFPDRYFALWMNQISYRPQAMIVFGRKEKLRKDF